MTVLIVLFVLAFLIVITNLQIVQQSRAYVVERMGAFRAVWEVGIHFKFPFIDRIAKKVSPCTNRLRTQLIVGLVVSNIRGVLKVS